MANREHPAAKPVIPVPTQYTREGETHIWTFPGEVTFKVIHPRYSPFHELKANVEAYRRHDRVNDATISLLDERDRVNFHNTALRRDRTIDWGNHLVSLASLVKDVLATQEPEGDVPEAKAQKPRPLIVHAHEIQEQKIRWLWAPYMPLGMIVMLDGDPGLGKSMMLIQVAANLSRGLPFLDQTGKPTIRPDVDGPQTTLVLSAEDSLEHVMIPRLKRAGADLTRIKFLQGWLGLEDEVHAFDLQHLSILVQAIEAHAPVLVVLDPIVAYLGDIDMYRANQTRPLMASLKQVAERYACTIIGVRHPSKLDQGGRLLYRGQGNIDIIGAARSALWVQQHPAHPETRSLMIHSKTNVGIPGRTIIFSRDQGTFQWVGVSRLTEAMVTGRGPEPYAFLEAFFWLEEIMRPGIPQKAADLERQATDKDISVKVLRRAKKLLGIISRQRDDGWYWLLPELSLTTTPHTEDIGDTEDTGTTGISDSKSKGYGHGDENPPTSVPSVSPVVPVVVRAPEDRCLTCGQSDWDHDNQGQLICIPCAEREP